MTMTQIKPARMTPKQQLALHLRYDCGWRLKRIAVRLGVRKSAVSRLLQRGENRSVRPSRRFFDPETNINRVRIRPESLSLTYHY
jgi:DNA-binding MarR family transcriptional regulator